MTCKSGNRSHPDGGPERPAPYSNRPVQFHDLDRPSHRRAVCQSNTFFQFPYIFSFQNFISNVAILIIKRILHLARCFGVPTKTRRFERFFCAVYLRTEIKTRQGRGPLISVHAMLAKTSKSSYRFLLESPKLLPKPKKSFLSSNFPKNSKCFAQCGFMRNYDFEKYCKHPLLTVYPNHLEISIIKF